MSHFRQDRKTTRRERWNKKKEAAHQHTLKEIFTLFLAVKSAWQDRKGATNIERSNDRRRRRKKKEEEEEAAAEDKDEEHQRHASKNGCKCTCLMDLL